MAEMTEGESFSWSWIGPKAGESTGTNLAPSWSTGRFNFRHHQSTCESTGRWFRLSRVLNSNSRFLVLVALTSTLGAQFTSFQLVDVNVIRSSRISLLVTATMAPLMEATLNLTSTTPVSPLCYLLPTLVTLLHLCNSNNSKSTPLPPSALSLVSRRPAILLTILD